jgi:hypothetical protein
MRGRDGTLSTSRKRIVKVCVHTLHGWDSTPCQKESAGGRSERAAEVQYSNVIVPPAEHSGSFPDEIARQGYWYANPCSIDGSRSHPFTWSTGKTSKADPHLAVWEPWRLDYGAREAFILLRQIMVSMIRGVVNNTR